MTRKMTGGAAALFCVGLSAFHSNNAQCADKPASINPDACPTSLTHGQAKELRDNLAVIVSDGKQTVKLTVFGTDTQALKKAVASSFSPSRVGEEIKLINSGDGDCTYERTPSLSGVHIFTVQTERYSGVVPGAKSSGTQPPANKGPKNPYDVEDPWK